VINNFYIGVCRAAAEVKRLR